MEASVLVLGIGTCMNIGMMELEAGVELRVMIQLFRVGISLLMRFSRLNV